MSADILSQLSYLGITLLIALLVWRYYRRRTFARSERYSTFGPRFWTGSVDSCVLWPIGFLATALLSLNIPRALAALLVVVESLAWLVYTVVMHARYGQTVGKMVTKVRVVDFRTEGNISWRQAWLREGIPMVLSFGFVGWQVFLILNGGLSPSAVASGGAFIISKGFWLLTALPSLWFVLEVLTMLTNKKRRALHDFIAGTVVIRTHAEDDIAQPNAAKNVALVIFLIIIISVLALVSVVGFNFYSAFHPSSYSSDLSKICKKDRLSEQDLLKAQYDLEHGANPNQSYGGLCMPLLEKVLSCNAYNFKNRKYCDKLVELLLIHGADPNDQYPEVGSFLHFAVGHIDTEKILLKYGARVSTSIYQYENILDLARENYYRHKKGSSLEEIELLQHALDEEKSHRR